MQTSEVFESRASECERTAQSARDPITKATWMRMAERWHRYAELAISASLSAALHDSDRRRKAAKAAPAWSRHH
jgi:hypothetical protein